MEQDSKRSILAIVAIVAVVLITLLSTRRISTPEVGYGYMASKEPAQVVAQSTPSQALPIPTSTSASTGTQPAPSQQDFLVTLADRIADTDPTSINTNQHFPAPTTKSPEQSSIQYPGDSNE